MNLLTDLAPQPSTLLGLLYEGVTANEGFQPFIQTLAQVFHLKAVVLVTRHTQQQAMKTIWLYGIDAADMESYALEYGQDDMLARHIHGSPINRFYASNLDLPAPLEEIENSRFYQEWIVPQGVAQAAGAIVLREGDWITEILAQRSTEQPSFIRAEMAALGELLPHLQRAVKMRQHFIDLQTRQSFLLGGPDALVIPTFLVDDGGKVAWYNKQAERLLSTNDSLSCQNGHLLAKDRDAARRIDHAISGAINLSNNPGQQSSTPIQLPRSARQPLTLIVTPLSFNTLGKQGRSALIFLFDPEQSRSISAEQVQVLFNLTRAEADLAVRLCQGKSLEECAKDKGISVNTARTQLRSIFAKTGTTRQSDLLALLFTSPAYFLSVPDEQTEPAKLT